MPNRRTPDAELSRAELLSLRRVAAGVGNVIPPDHGETLTRMGLAQRTDAGVLVLTVAGWQREGLEMGQ